MDENSFARNAITSTLTVAALLVLATPSVSQEKSVSIIIVRHQETDPTQASQPVFPLSNIGRQRAELLVHTLGDIKFTHMFASHTSRSREAIQGLATKRGLSVVQMPAPGSLLEGERVTDQTTRRAAIDPIAAALMQLPPGSVALVGLNSENIYAIMNKLGVPVAAEGKSCSHGSMCVPCTNNTCFPRDEFDRIWYLVRDPGRSDPVAFLEFRYGAGWQSTER